LALFFWLFSPSPFVLLRSLPTGSFPSPVFIYPRFRLFYLPFWKTIRFYSFFVCLSCSSDVSVYVPVYPILADASPSSWNSYTLDLLLSSSLLIDPTFLILCRYTSFSSVSPSSLFLFISYAYRSLPRGCLPFFRFPSQASLLGSFPTPQPAFLNIPNLLLTPQALDQFGCECPSYLRTLLFFISRSFVQNMPSLCFCFFLSLSPLCQDSPLPHAVFIGGFSGFAPPLSDA